MYLDPGFGGMLLQVIVVIIAMGGAILFSLRKKLRNLFSRNKDVNSNMTTSGQKNNQPSTIGNTDADNETDIIDALETDK